MSAKLDIVIVGAGLSGLSAAIQCALSGHSVTVLESTRELAEVGAGLQLTPNATRLLQRWGVYDKIKAQVCEVTAMTVLKYTGEVLAHADDFSATLQAQYGAPFADCHRADLQRALAARAHELGVAIVLAARVLRISCGAHPGAEAAVVTAAGHAYTADIVLGADGLWSTCRSTLLGRHDAPQPTGDLAYRIVLDVQQLEDADLRALVAQQACRYWAGPDSHAVAFSMRSGTQLNVALVTPDDMRQDEARSASTAAELREKFAAWDPTLTRLLASVSTVDKWKLMHRPPLASWINTHANLVLLGDACHPMLPYLAQGANSSIEDGAVLGLVLSPDHGFTHASQLPRALRLFERLRKARSERIAVETFHQRRDFHLRDGPEQQARDELMQRMLKSGKVEAPFPSRSTCPDVQAWLYAYDAMQEVAVAACDYYSTPSIDG